MAILKFINAFEDFDANNAFVSTDPDYVDTTRVEHGYAFNNNESISASWPEPAGNTVWIHWRHGQDSSATSWDDFGVPRFIDAKGNQVMVMDLIDGVMQWSVNGDTTSVGSVFAVAGVGTMLDIQFTKNGTTDLTVNVYRNGSLVIGPLTVGNTQDRGLPVALHTTHGDDSAQGTQYFSECVIADEDTRGWRIRQHRVVAYGVFTDWDGSVNAIIDQQKSTGITSNTLDNQVSFGLSNLNDIPMGATIDRVAIQSTLIRGATGLASFNHFFRWADTTVVQDSDVALNLTMTEYIAEYTTSPDTTLAWTYTEMQGLQAGVRART